MNQSGGWSSSARFKQQISKTTIVLSIPDEDIRFIRMAIEMKEYQLPAIERFLAQVEKQLPKDET